MICKSFSECFTVDLRRFEPDISFYSSFKMCFVESRILALVLMRLSQWLFKKRGVWRIAPFVKRLNEVVTGFECHLLATIEKGLFVAHTQNLVIGAGVQLGENVTLYNGVTLGAVERGTSNGSIRYPIVGDEATIYTGAKILGPITIGEKSIVGANAVVIKNVPPNTIAVGVPAKILVPKERAV